MTTFNNTQQATNNCNLKAINTHNGRREDMTFAGFWKMKHRDGGDMFKLAMDMGEVMHCLNSMSISDAGELELSPRSIGGTYSPNYSGTAEEFSDRLYFEDDKIIERVRFETTEEAVEYLRSYIKMRNTHVREKKAA